MTRTKAIMIVSLFVVCLSGCHGDIKDICEGMANCEKGNNNDQDACEEEYKGELNAAAEYDCKSEYKDALECEADKSKCVDNYYGYGVKVYTPEDRCDGKYEKLYSCVEKNSEWY